MSPTAQPVTRHVRSSSDPVHIKRDPQFTTLSTPNKYFPHKVMQPSPQNTNSTMRPTDRGPGLSRPRSLSIGSKSLQERRNSPLLLSVSLPCDVVNDEDTRPEMSDEEIDQLFHLTLQRGGSRPVAIGTDRSRGCP